MARITEVERIAGVRARFHVVYTTSKGKFIEPVFAEQAENAGQAIGHVYDLVREVEGERPDVLTAHELEPDA